MVPFQDALNIILKAIRQPGKSRIPTRESFGRVLAEDAVLTRDFPDCRLSAIDGYALRDLTKTAFHLKGEVAAGAIPDFTLQSGECAAVMTGAPVPDGTDCMVRIENCDIISDIVTPNVKLVLGDLINEIGSEAVAGTTAVKAGEILDKSVFPAIFYAGIPEVTVHDLPKIGMLLTGDELCDVDQTPVKGQVYNTNCYTLEAIVRSLGMEITRQVEAKDEEETTQRAFEELAENCDIIVSSGGVSMGRYDFVKKTFKERDYEILIQKTKIRPGSPLMLASAKNKLFFGMPGYPSAFLTNCLVYLVPALKKAMGRTTYHHQPITAKLTDPIRSKPGSRLLARVNLENQNGEWIARVPENTKTSHFLTFAKSNAVAILDEETGDLNPGDSVPCLHMDLELS